ncbi:MAG: T9SS type A sorting domain-containing protein, partial [Flavobacteriales bacterium]|nr:T9SS type A sorting domain-containing protein [Flavobacteriales bacterium]
HTTVPTVTINWPSGLEETFTNFDADRTITVIENTCISPQASITTPGEPIVCGNGDGITLTANAGFNYTWSNGSNDQSIDVTEAGSYTVTIDDGQGCSGITSIFVEQSPDETPTVSVSGDTQFCEGGEVVLTSSDANGYTWTGGIGGQSITVANSGSYAVTIQGACGEFTSAPIVVEVLDAPVAPNASNVAIPAPGSAQLNAAGANISWYDMATGGAVIGTGNTFNTPVVSTTTSFWCSSSNVYGGGTAFGGRTENDANGVYHTNADNYLFFEAYEAFTINSVKVYANGAGNRTIAVIDRSNGSTVASGVFSVPDGESRVDLEFDVPGPGEYGLRVVGGNPQMWRDGLGSNPAYPYSLGTMGAITSSSVGGANATAYYYFFYDWEVTGTGVACEGPRTEVVVQVGTVGLEELAGSDGIQVYPNPASDVLTIAFGEVSGRITIDMMDIAGRTIRSVNADRQALHAGLLQVDLNGLAAGEYAVRVRHDAGASVHRVVVR